MRFDRLDPAPFSIDIGTSENLVLNANGGNDTFSATGNLAALIKITVDGGAGDDTLLGSNGIDLLLGGDGNDFIDGQQGNDVALMGAGDDTFQWDPGDGSDIVEGQDGTDTMLFNGQRRTRSLTSSANGGRVRFTRNLGNIVMDLNDVETIDLERPGRNRHHHGQRPQRHRPGRGQHQPGRHPRRTAGDGAGRYRHRQRHQRRRHISRSSARRRRRGPSSGCQAAVNITNSEGRPTTG